MNLRRSLFILPNLFTLSSVLCGFYAILLCTENATDDQLYRASLLIVFAMFFDTIDGRVARLTRTQSAIGVQLDSLADIVSFGVAPGVLVYRWSLHEFETVGLLVGFAYLAAGTVRLARFNVLATDTSGEPMSPGKYIVGLPIPAAAGMLVSFMMANTLTGKLPGSPLVVMIVVLALAFFMVSTVRFRSFKDLKLTWRTGLLVVLAVGSTVFVSIHHHPSLAAAWLLAAYVLVGVLEALISLSRTLLGRRRE